MLKTKTQPLKLAITSLTLILTLTGCGVLYGDRQNNVPVYSNTSKKSDGRVIAKSGISKTKRPALISNSVEDPYSATGAVEQGAQEQSVSLADTLKNGRIKKAETILRPNSEAGTDKVEEVNAQVASVKNGVEETGTETATKIGKVKEEASNIIDKAESKATDTVSKAVKSDTPAISTLYAETQKYISEGNLEAASASMERANRIEPRNSGILFNIAKIKKAQGNYKQAESFASKAVAYSNNNTRSKSIWLFLSDVRRKLGQNTAADSAAKKAATF